MFALTARAAYIDGAIGFSGSYAANNADLSLATSITFGSVTLSADSAAPVGTFADEGLQAGDPVAMFSPLMVNQGGGSNPTGVILPAGPIWTVGGFSMQLTSLVESSNHSGALGLSGIGLISHAGYWSTPGDIELTFLRSGTGRYVRFNFTSTSATNPPAVPEGTATIALLATTMLALAAYRLRAAKRV